MNQEYTQTEARACVRLLRELEEYYRKCAKAGYNEDISSTLSSVADGLADRSLCHPFWDASVEMDALND